MNPPLPIADCYASATVPSRVESIRLAAAFIVQAARNMEVPPASDPLFEVAIVESLNNALMHGAAKHGEGGMIVCELELINQRFTVRILDRGPGFVLSQRPPPVWREDDIMSVPESGFGLPIIRDVFSMVRTIERPGEFGLEMALTF